MFVSSIAEELKHSPALADSTTHVDERNDPSL
jgi:hypothetical protein